MLDSLIKLGKHISQKRDEWDDIILSLNPLTETKQGIPLENRILEIVFDIDEGQIIISKENIGIYYDKAPFDFKLIKTQGGKSGKTYVATLVSKVEHLKLSMFDDGNRDKGQFQNDIDNKFPTYKSTPFYKALKEIYTLNDQSENLDKKSIEKQLQFPRNRKLIFCYVSIKSKNLGLLKPTPLATLDGCKKYYYEKFIKKTTNKEKKLCYATGEILEDVSRAKFKRGYNLNAMFVTTTKNYAQGFGEKSFNKNYQLNSNNKHYIEVAAEHLKTHYSTDIAGIKHLVIPQFRFTSEIDFEIALSKISQKSELLFNIKELNELANNIDVELDIDDFFWINFLAFDSDGKSFKTINLIKDVSKFQFQNVLKTFEEVDWEMNDINGVYWTQIMTRNEGRKRLNFYTIYHNIPVRIIKNKVIKNDALCLFKDILEKRKINTQILFASFCKLMICYRSGQFDKNTHRSFPNIKFYGNFDFEVRNAVFKYLAFLQVLKKLKLINMNTQNENENENEIQQLPQTSAAEIQQQQINAFFKKMEYSPAQKAMFYLGKALNAVAKAQYNKKHKSKPVLNKINYNGMDKDHIERLRIDLGEKTQQYQIHYFTEDYFEKFTEFFDYNNWEMSSQESIFFILTGYSFNTHS